MKKQIIWTSETFLDDDTREEYQQYQREILEDDEYCITDREWAEVVDGFFAATIYSSTDRYSGVVANFSYDYWTHSLYIENAENRKVADAIINAFKSFYPDEIEID